MSPLVVLTSLIVIYIHICVDTIFTSLLGCKNFESRKSFTPRALYAMNIMQRDSYNSGHLPAEDVILEGVRLKFLCHTVQGMWSNVRNSEVGTEIVFNDPLRFSV